MMTLRLLVREKTAERNYLNPTEYTHDLQTNVGPAVPKAAPPTVYIERHKTSERATTSNFVLLNGVLCM
jgi:hypothetical protein